MKTRSTFLSLIVIVISNFANASVWDATRSWNQDSEAEYARWVSQNLRSDIFSNPSSPYYDVSTDCADAVYGIRAIFAFERGLPFAAKDESGKIISNLMSRFNSTSNRIERFKKFLHVLFANTSTRTLADATYPIAVNREALTPGTIYLRSGGHAGIIKGVNSYGIPVVYESAMPNKVRVLSIYGDFPDYLAGDSLTNLTTNDGYRRFKQPQDLDRSDSDFSDLSFEHFRLASRYANDPDQLERIYTQRLRIPGKVETLDLVTERRTRNLCQAATNLAETILDADTFKQEYGNNCLTETEYHQYSTPLKAKFVKSQFEKLKRLADSSGWSEINGQRKFQAIYAIFYGQDSFKNELFELCPTISVGYGWFTLRQIESLIGKGFPLPDPNLTADERWGIKSATSYCPTY